MQGSYTINSAAQSDIGLKRSRNEDAHGSLPLSNGYLFIVCDGMGGHAGGEWASKACVELIIEYFSKHVSDDQNPSISLNNAILFANEQIFNAAYNNPDLKGMGTTVVALLFYRDEIYTAHVGDSRIYVLHRDQLIQLTRDHSFVQGLVDQGIISKIEAETHPRKNELTNAIGVRKNIMPEISTSSYKAVKGDRFLLCTDGLCGFVGDVPIKEALDKYNNPVECANNLIKLVLNEGAPDNVTVILVDIERSLYSKSFYGHQIALAKTTRKRLGRLITIIVLITIIAGTAGYYLLNFFNQGQKKNLEEKSEISKDKSSLVIYDNINTNKIQGINIEISDSGSRKAIIE